MEIDVVERVAGQVLLPCVDMRLFVGLHRSCLVLGSNVPLLGNVGHEYLGGRIALGRNGVVDDGRVLQVVLADVVHLVIHMLTEDQPAADVRVVTAALKGRQETSRDVAGRESRRGQVIQVYDTFGERHVRVGDEHVDIGDRSPSLRVLRPRKQPLFHGVLPPADIVQPHEAVVASPFVDEVDVDPIPDHFRICLG